MKVYNKIQRYPTKMSHWLWVQAHVVLFFFVVTSLFLPVQMVEASVPRIVPPDFPDLLSQQVFPIQQSAVVLVPLKKKGEHPVESFSQALQVLKRSVKMTNLPFLTPEEALLNNLSLAVSIKAVRESESSLYTYFEKVSHTLLQSKLSDKIQLRHKQTLMNHQANYQWLNNYLTAWEKSFLNNITRWDKSKPASGLKSEKSFRALYDLWKIIDQMVPERPYNTLDLARLPRRESLPVLRSPFQSADKFRIYAMDEDKVFSTLTNIAIAGEIKHLTDRLGKDPLEIYKWVRSNISFVPTHGFKKSALACLHSKKGNAFDIANLLIEMLRASGTSARFVLGTIQVDEWRFRKILGDFKLLEPALRLARHGGIPVRAVDNNKNVQIEHIWVEALLNTTDDQWLPLDAALKPAQIKSRSLSISTKHAAGKLLDGLLSAVQPSDDRIAISAFKKKSRFLGKMITMGARFNSPPNALQHHVAFQVVDYQSKENITPPKRLPTMRLSDQPIRITYDPAEAGDRNTIKAFGGIGKTPPYLIQLKPTLRIGESIYLSGNPVSAGTPQELRVWFFDPAGNQDYADHLLTAGQHAVLGLDCQQNGAKILMQFQHNPSEIKTLEKIVQTYFKITDQSAGHIAGKKEVAAIKTGEEALASYELICHRGIAGTELAVSGRRVVFDVQRSLHVSASHSGIKDSEQSYHSKTSKEASLAEYKAIEAVTGKPSISAAKLSNMIHDKFNKNHVNFFSKTKYAEGCYPFAFKGLKNMSTESSSESVLEINTISEYFSAYILTDNATGIGNFFIESNYGGAMESAGQELDMINKFVANIMSYETEQLTKEWHSLVKNLNTKFQSALNISSNWINEFAKECHSLMENLITKFKSGLNISSNLFNEFFQKWGSVFIGIVVIGAIGLILSLAIPGPIFAMSMAFTGIMAVTLLFMVFMSFVDPSAIGLDRLEAILSLSFCLIVGLTFLIVPAGTAGLPLGMFTLTALGIFMSVLILSVKPKP